MSVHFWSYNSVHSWRLRNNRQRQSPDRRAGTAEAPVNTGIALPTFMCGRHGLREQGESADRIAEWPSPLIAGTRRPCSPLIVRVAPGQPNA
jgi:hypothetical protein